MCQANLIAQRVQCLPMAPSAESESCRLAAVRGGARLLGPKGISRYGSLSRRGGGVIVLLPTWPGVVLLPTWPGVAALPLLMLLTPGVVAGVPGLTDDVPGATSSESTLVLTPLGARALAFFIPPSPHLPPGTHSFLHDPLPSSDFPSSDLRGDRKATRVPQSLPASDTPTVPVDAGR